MLFFNMLLPSKVKVRSFCFKFLKLVCSQMFQLCFFLIRKQIIVKHWYDRVLVNWLSSAARMRVGNDCSSLTFSQYMCCTLGYMLVCCIYSQANFCMWRLTLHCSTVHALLMVIWYMKQKYKFIKACPSVLTLLLWSTWLVEVRKL